ncbi:MAG TPA: iron-containing alcohol dehydrogenase [Candidatus Aphodousia faecipullorum]|nr:iron-containing alcohol dehydrogenase [Candidatus Aphodousia faecipullorum]
MFNFVFQNTTKLVFGRGQIAQLQTLIEKNKKVLVTFGGGSVKRNGVYEQVREALKDHNTVEFWGIEPNPAVETLRKAIKVGLDEQVDMVLAVGGGSVLDGTKLIAAGIACPDTDAWTIVKTGTATKQIPFASVMTLPATGSEMNNGAVISCHETKEKFAFRGDYPVFSILDPETTYSLPKHQIACSLADIVVHCFEQYMTTSGQSRVLDRWAEGVIATAMEVAPLIQADQHNYDVMADYMFSATMALNNFIRMGVTQDWSTHQIGHELTALCGVTHGESLAIVYPGTAEVLREQKKAKLLQFGERVLGVCEGSEDERVDQVIAKIEAFFKSLGLATRLSEKGIGVDVVEEIARRFNERGVHFGEAKNVTGDVAREILMKRL